MHAFKRLQLLIETKLIRCDTYSEHKGIIAKNSKKKSKAGKLLSSYSYLSWEQRYSIVILKQDIQHITEKQYLTSNNFITIKVKLYGQKYLINVYLNEMKNWGERYRFFLPSLFRDFDSWPKFSLWFFSNNIISSE